MTATVDTDAIGAEAASGTPIPTTSDLLAQRLDQVDLLIADLGQASEFTSKAVSFVDEATKEAAWNRKARFCTLLVVLAMLLGIARIVWLLVDSEGFEALRNNPVAFSTALAATVGGGILLATSVSKAVFSTFAERNSGVPMPDHLKAIVDGIGGIFSKR